MSSIWILCICTWLGMIATLFVVVLIHLSLKNVAADQQVLYDRFTQDFCSQDKVLTNMLSVQRASVDAMKSISDSLTLIQRYEVNSDVSFRSLVEAFGETNSLLKNVQFITSTILKQYPDVSLVLDEDGNVINEVSFPQSASTKEVTVINSDKE